MTSLRNRIVFSCLSIVGTAGLVSFSNPAWAMPAVSVDGVRQASVFTADLDLSKQAGRATFDHRVNAAARSVCAEDTRAASAAEAACRRDALAQARRDAGIVDVAAD